MVYGKLDVAIVEACAITEEGNIIPTTSMGNTASFVQQADMVIVEVILANHICLLNERSCITHRCCWDNITFFCNSTSFLR